MALTRGQYLDLKAADDKRKEREAARVKADKEEREIVQKWSDPSAIEPAFY